MRPVANEEKRTKERTHWFLRFSSNKMEGRASRPVVCLNIQCKNSFEDVLTDGDPGRMVVLCKTSISRLFLRGLPVTENNLDLLFVKRYLWKRNKAFFSDFNLILRQNMKYAHNCLLRRLEFCTVQHSNNVKELYSGIEMDGRKCCVKK